MIAGGGGFLGEKDREEEREDRVGRGKKNEFFILF